jgi:hypothetical protein
MRRLTVLLLATSLASCLATLDSGHFGGFRYVGQAKGTAPLRMVPPVSDRNGNIYSLAGGLDVPEALAFVSRFAGGSAAACAITKGDTVGVHGWVGIGQSRAWYWSGDALVVVNEDGSCAQILDRDPSTDSNLLFRAVMPWVREGTTAHAHLVALIESPVDPAPFSALVDLDVGILTNVVAFDPSDATDVRVLGVGSDPASATGFALVEYQRPDGFHMEGRFYDATGNLQAVSPVKGSEIDAYSIPGFLQMNSTGAVVGLTNKGLIVAFDRSSGAFSSPVSGMTPVAVHRWGDALWLVGTAGGKPMVAPLDDSGNPGGAVEWGSSETAAAALGGSLSLTDDRSFPARATTWNRVVTAMGDFPFLSPQSPWPHSPDTTLWAVAGPQFQAGGFQKTAFAVAPAGISYP